VGPVEKEERMVEAMSQAMRSEGEQEREMAG
jgi:hypothetical protein